ncbi:MAG TPA: peptide chain release factor N(5)-glutamine methyltransferase [Desulfobacterales bacterium]|nr:peptide chain release factor N(5)-glutamine methyltransferase [Desulfobacterales bacterium]
MLNQSKLQPAAKKSQWTIFKILSWTTSYFKSYNIDNPRATAEILLAHALKLKRIDLYLQYDQPLSERELYLFKKLIIRRIRREPVAYIVGKKEFWSMELKVTKDVLIPRPETEHLAEAALSLLPDFSSAPKRILELGTGSGAVILALASQRPKHLFFASDCSINAIKLAKKNARRHNLEKAIYFLSGSWFAPIKKDIHPFDMIISNPPYIPTQTIGGLQAEIYRYEPKIALDGGRDGLGCIRDIIYCAHNYLEKDGSLLLEIGYDQKENIREIIQSCGRYYQIIFTKDYSGLDRIVQMKKAE